MKKNKFIKLSSLMLSVIVLGSVLNTAQPVQASETTSQVTHIDFENGENPFTIGREGNNTKDGNTWATDVTVTSLSEGGNALHLTATNNTEYTTFLTEGWAEGTRPTKVQYKFKGVNKDGSVTANSKRAFSFLPIYTSTKVHNSFGYPSLLRFSDVASGQYIKGGMVSANGTVCALSAQTPTNQNIVLGTSEAAAEWYSVACNYDWSLFKEEDSYQYVVSIEITDAEGIVVFSSTATHAAGTGATNIMTGMNGKTLSFGFMTGNANGLEAYVDDIYIWSEAYADSATEKGTLYGPFAQPKVLGATPATNTSNNSIKVKMGFDFSSVTAIAEANGETPIQYGAVLVPGSPEYGAMVTNAGLLLDADETNDGAATELGYKYTKRELTGDVVLPAEYYVTISNSNENIAKRASAISYVVTEDAEGVQHIYYSASTINHSVMSLLKAAFNQTYLADTNNVLEDAIVSGSSLETALNNYNASNGTTETLATIKVATTGGATTEAQRNLLVDLHLALNNQ